MMTAIARRDGSQGIDHRAMHEGDILGAWATMNILQTPAICSSIYCGRHLAPQGLGRDRMKRNCLACSLCCLDALRRRMHPLPHDASDDGPPAVDEGAELGYAGSDLPHIPGFRPGRWTHLPLPERRSPTHSWVLAYIRGRCSSILYLNGGYVAGSESRSFGSPRSPAPRRCCSSRALRRYSRMTLSPRFLKSNWRGKRDYLKRYEQMERRCWGRGC